MKSLTAILLSMILLTCVALAEDTPKPPIRHGLRVEMAVADHAVPVPAADAQDAIVLAVAADGKVFVDANPVELTALSNLGKGVVYVKADARVPYQKILAVLDALHGRTVVLLTAPAVKPEKDAVVPPYGMKIVVGG